MSSSERHWETKGQFRIRNDLIKWLKIWVDIGLGRLSSGLTADEGKQLRGSGTETHLHSWFLFLGGCFFVLFAPGPELLCGFL